MDGCHLLLVSDYISNFDSGYVMYSHYVVNS